MVTKYAARWFSVLAIVVFGLFSGVAFAAPEGSALPGLSGRVCSYIDVSQLPYITGPNKCENDSSSAGASAALTGQEIAAQYAATHAAAASASLSAPAVKATDSAALTGQEKAALWLTTASAAPVISADSQACRVMSFHVDALYYDQSVCSTASAAQIIPLTGTYLPASAFHAP